MALPAVIIPVAGAAGAAVKGGFFAGVFLAIKGAISKIVSFIGRHQTAVDVGVRAGTSVLVGSSFETKNKKITFSNTDSFKINGSSYTVPGIHIADKRRSKYNEKTYKYSSRSGRTRSSSSNYHARSSYNSRSYGGSSYRSSNDWNRPSYPRR